MKCKKLNWPWPSHSISLTSWAARGDEETNWISEMHASCLNPRRRIRNATWDDTWSDNRRKDSLWRSLVTGTGLWWWIDWNGWRSRSFYHRTDDDGGESLRITSSFKAFLHDWVIFITNMDFNSIQLDSSQELIVDCPLQNLDQKFNSIRQLFLATLIIFSSFYTCFYH